MSLKSRLFNIMVKGSGYIRSFTPAQKEQLEKIAAAHNIKTTKGVLLFALQEFYTKQLEVDRLNRIIMYKQNKIERLENSEN